MLYMGKHLLTISDPAMQKARSNSYVGAIGSSALVRVGNAQLAQLDMQSGIPLPGHIFLVKSELIWISEYDMDVLWPKHKQ